MPGTDTTAAVASADACAVGGLEASPTGFLAVLPGQEGPAQWPT